MEIVVDVLNCILEMWIAAFFFSAFQIRRVSKKALLFAVIGTGTVYALILIFQGFGTFNWFISFSLTYLVALCYRFKWYNAIWITAIISLLSSISEMILVMLLTLSGMTVSATQENIYTYIIGVLLSKTITCAVILVVHKGRHHLFQSARNDRFLGIMLLPIASTLIMLVFLNFCMQYNIANVWKVLSIVALIILIIANVTIFYIIDRQYELISTRQKLKMSKVLLENQRQYYDSIFESQQEIRKIRHDLKNSFLAVLANIDSGNTGEARKLVQSQLSDAERNIYLSSRETDNIINSVIYSKKELAKQQHVQLDATVTVHEQITMDDLDLAVLLGNLMDNAIEAVARLEENRRHIELTVLAEDGRLVIVSENPVLENIDTNRLDTIKSDKKNHGYGLLSIKSIVEKYSGFCAISCENNVFLFTAHISNDVCTSKTDE